MNKKDEKLKKELIKTSKAIRKKYKALKLGQAEEASIREQVYKPITEPLRQIIKQSKVKPEIKLETTTTTKQDVAKHVTPSKYSTPNILATDVVAESSPIYDDDDDENVFREPLQTHEEVLQLFLEQYDPLPRQYLEKLLKDDSREMDYTYGVHYDQINDSWSLGNTPIQIIGSDIKINNVTYKGTRGLYELLFKDKPLESLIKENDKKAYKQIMDQTNFHKQGFLSKNRIKSNRGYKYSSVIKPLLEEETPTSKQAPYATRARRIQTWGGEGVSPKMTYSNRSMEYVYWNKPAELVSRLRLLWASKMAGNNNHENEILSIIEELREENIIY